jgi:hypothetical protein
MVQTMRIPRKRRDGFARPKRMRHTMTSRRCCPVMPLWGAITHRQPQHLRGVIDQILFVVHALSHNGIMDTDETAITEDWVRKQFGESFEALAQDWAASLVYSDEGDYISVMLSWTDGHGGDIAITLVFDDDGLFVSSHYNWEVITESRKMPYGKWPLPKLEELLRKRKRVLDESRCRL